MIAVPLVSVIVPTYNRRPMVRVAVESVLGQTYSSFELIIVDDGSTDGSFESLSGCDPSATIIRQERKGVAAARNAGVAIAHGKYVAFLDSDDLWARNKLAIQTEFMEQNPGVVICQTQEVWLRDGVRVNPKNKHRKRSGDIFQASLDLCLVSPSCVMMTRSLFKDIGGFDEAFPVCEDYDLWLRIAVDHPVELIDMPLVIKRGGHADQLSRSMWGMDRFRALAIAKLLRAGLAGERRQWALTELRKKLAILANGAKKRGNPEAAQQFVKLGCEFVEELGDVGTRDSKVCKEERTSSAYR
jgi:glycosyltransferase involved in cell wall biosynthesis